jgi:hypothetical protein
MKHPVIVTGKQWGRGIMFTTHLHLVQGYKWVDLHLYSPYMPLLHVGGLQPAITIQLSIDVSWFTELHRLFRLRAIELKYDYRFILGCFPCSLIGTYRHGWLIFIRWRLIFWSPRYKTLFPPSGVLEFGVGFGFLECKCKLYVGRSGNLRDTTL